MQQFDVARQVSLWQKAAAFVMCAAMIMGLGPWYGVSQAFAGNMTAQDTETITVSATPVTSLESGKSYVFMASDGTNTYAMKAEKGMNSLKGTQVAVATSGETSTITLTDETAVNHTWAASSYYGVILGNSGKDLVADGNVVNLDLEEDAYYPVVLEYKNGGFVADDGYGSDSDALSMTANHEFMLFSNANTFLAQAYEVVESSGGSDPADPGNTDPALSIALAAGTHQGSGKTSFDVLTGESVTLYAQVQSASKGDIALVADGVIGSNAGSQEDIANLKVKWYKDSVADANKIAESQVAWNSYYERPSWTTDLYQNTGAISAAGTYKFYAIAEWSLDGFTSATSEPLEFTVVATDPVTSAITGVVSPSAGGTISFKVNNESVTQAQTGDEVTVVATPSEGYVLKSITVKDTDNQDVYYSEYYESFDMPAKPVTVTAAFEQVVTSDIETAVSEHGTVVYKVNGSAVTQANNGDVVRVVVTPDSGWKVASISAKDANNVDIEVREDYYGRTVFTMPASKASVSVTYVEKTKFNVTKAADINTAQGDISFDKTQFTAGDTVGVTIVPIDGYELDTLSFAKPDGTAVSTYKYGDYGLWCTVANDGLSASIAIQEYWDNAGAGTNSDLVVGATFKKATQPEKKTWTLTGAQNLEHGAVTFIGEDGTESDSVDVTAEGGEFVAKVTPALGYEIDTVTLKNANGGELDAGNNLIDIFEDNENPGQYFIQYDNEEEGLAWPTTTYVTPTFKLATTNTTADVATGVAATGGIFTEQKPADVASYGLSVGEVPAATAAQIEDDYAGQIGGNDVAGVYEVDLIAFKNNGDTQNITEGVGEMKLSFPVDAADGTKTKVIQLHENGTANPDVITYNDLTVQNKKVEVPLKEGKLSTFIVTTETKAGEPTVTTYQVTFDSNGGSAVAAAKVESGKTVAKPADPTRSGYTFKEWQLDGKAYDFSKPVTAAMTLKATWSEDVSATTYGVNIASGIEHGTVTTDAKDGRASVGQTVTVTATPDEGYTLDKITVTNDKTGEAVEVEDGKFAMPGIDVTVGAVFKKDEGGKVSMFRLYNPNSGEHFYTAAQDEHDNLVSLGWNDEGYGWTAPETSSTPVYRLYNPYGGEHHYTMDASERDNLVSLGWNDEGIGWYSDDSKGQVLYREYNPNAFSNNHNYTVDKTEHDWLISLGWNDEGTAWYGLAG